MIYVFKGRYYYSLSSYESCIIALMQANTIYRTILAYEYLVYAQLDMSNLKEAKYIAKEAVTSFTHHPTSYVLLGMCVYI